MPRKRRICFVTGTRAEFGLMRSTLEAIRARPDLELQLVVTGMHLDRRHGSSIGTIREGGWKVDATVPWNSVRREAWGTARATGNAIVRLSEVFARLKTDVVLVVGDRVEAFAAASAAHIGQIAVAHVHGGDRAEGVIDDSLRHAITKLSHIHFPATAASHARILRLGEDAKRVHCVGTPGLDDIKRLAGSIQGFPKLQRHRYALLVMHPDREGSELNAVINAIVGSGIEQIVAIFPNNDPGADKIIRTLERHRSKFCYLLKDAPREQFLGRMRDAAVLVGNSSSGMIEAASFGTPVLNIGPRQAGRERSQNVADVPCREADIRRAIRQIWNDGEPQRFHGKNVYGRGGAGRRVAGILSRVRLDNSLFRKLISY
jgi:UDP-hydrolysing UDP-N-acetyl-D-glucosamine 2-epimerase